MKLLFKTQKTKWFTNRTTAAVIRWHHLLKSCSNTGCCVCGTENPKLALWLNSELYHYPSSSANFQAFELFNAYKCNELKSMHVFQVPSFLLPFTLPCKALLTQTRKLIQSEPLQEIPPHMWRQIWLTWIQQRDLCMISIAATYSLPSLIKQHIKRDDPG